MKNGRYIYDERVQNELKKAEGQGFKAAVVLILASMLIKTLVFKLPAVSAYIDMAVIAILSVYVNVKGINSGSRVIPAKLGESNKAKYIRTIYMTFAAAIAVTLILGAMDYFIYNLTFVQTVKSLWPLATVFPAVLSLLRILFDILSIKKAEKNISE